MNKVQLSLTFAAAVLLNVPGFAQANELGRQLAERGNCVACHGPGLNRPPDGATPRLAGQHSDYLRAAMRSYQIEGNPIVGRDHPTMKAVLKPYSPAEIDALARYIEQLPRTIHTKAQSGFR